jgi:hypothetical protein
MSELRTGSSRRDAPHQPHAQWLCPGTTNGTARSAVDRHIGRPSARGSFISPVLVRFRSGYEGGGGDGSELQLLMRSLEEFFQAEAAGALHLRIGLKPQQ